MTELYIHNGRDVSGAPVAVLITDGVIAEVGTELTVPVGCPTLDAQGCYITAGWIDDHTHCNAHAALYYDDADAIGYRTGVTTVIDAGSTGADNVADLYQQAHRAATNVYALLNIARTGIVAQDELADLNQLSFSALRTAIQRYPDFIVGLKVRVSKSVVGDNGVEPLRVAKQYQADLTAQLPLMVHIGSNPPELAAIIALMRPGDVLTHCFNGKPNGIVNSTGEVAQYVRKAYQKGLIFDVGHGTDSFSFRTAALARTAHLFPQTLSSDIYYRNRLNGPVYSLAVCVEKLLLLGYRLEEIIPMITTNPARIFKLTHKEQLCRGYDADLTIFQTVTAPQIVVDSTGEERIAPTQVIPTYSVIAGRVYTCGVDK